jgi:hypothetical protein
MNFSSKKIKIFLKLLDPINKIYINIKIINKKNKNTFLIMLIRIKYLKIYNIHYPKILSIPFNPNLLNIKILLEATLAACLIDLFQSHIFIFLSLCFYQLFILNKLKQFFIILWCYLWEIVKTAPIKHYP